MLGTSFSVTKHRGEVLESNFSARTVATFHPSSVLRAGDDRRDAMDAFVADLRVVAGLLERAG